MSIKAVDLNYGSKAVSTSIGGFQVDADGVWNH